jgi:hypothetical protein
MSKEIDISTLREFLEWSGSSIYFKNAPFITHQATAMINSVDPRTLDNWVRDFNDSRQGLMSEDDITEDPID